MVRYVAVALVLVAVVGLAFSVGAQSPQPVDKGPEQIKINGGTQGMVPFPHRRHQNALDDCLVCHSNFAQEKGSIEKAKADGKLAKKQVMNKLCIHCHRTEKQAGKKAGPTTCSKCHVKE